MLVRKAAAWLRRRSPPSRIPNPRHLVALMLLLGMAAGAQAAGPVIDYSLNPIRTTPYGPPEADIVLQPSNFVPCSGGPIALCYYSGPEPQEGQPDLSCEVTDDPNFSNCRCVEIPSGRYFVDINAILDKDIYLATVKTCGKTGADCAREPNKAPVCAAIQQNQLLPDAVPTPDTISTFSLALNSVPGYAIGQTNCPPQPDDPVLPYAGCMTAPCVRADNESFVACSGEGDDEVCQVLPIDICTCPNYTGPYQVGQKKAECDIGRGEPGDNIWSAAYNPGAKTPPAITCIPDAVGNSGCPLLPPDPDSDPLAPIIPERPKGISCGKVCAEYRDTKNADGIEVGFTCDATLCTTPPGTLSPDSPLDPEELLVVKACAGLTDGKKGISEIAKLELAVGCSCCASQICGCEASTDTDSEIRNLNELQREVGIQPQCDYNGSLCGEP
jgi:hypothetical protein